LAIVSFRDSLGRYVVATVVAGVAPANSHCRGGRVARTPLQPTKLPLHFQKLLQFT